MIVRVETADEFEGMVQRLRKRFRLIRSDVGKLISDLERGVRPQDERLQNMGGMRVFKARLRNTSAGRGKRGGFRVVYRVMDDGTIILLLLIWSKTDISDVPTAKSAASPANIRDAESIRCRGES